MSATGVARSQQSHDPSSQPRQALLGSRSASLVMELPRPLGRLLQLAERQPALDRRLGALQPMLAAAIAQSEDAGLHVGRLVDDVPDLFLLAAMEHVLLAFVGVAHDTRQE